MPIKSLLLALILIILLTALSYLGVIPFQMVVISFVAYAFIVGLWIELDELDEVNAVKEGISPKIESVEKHLYKVIEKIGYEQRIGQRLEKKKKDIVDWLSRF